MARPSTPFPHTHTLSHSSSGSNYQIISQGLHYANPLHFTPRALPSLTPPSLLARAPSSSSTMTRERGLSSPAQQYIHLARTPSIERVERRPSQSSDYEERRSTNLSRTPSLVAPSPRRLSSSFDSGRSSPVLPVTPVIETFRHALPPTHFALPPQQFPEPQVASSSSSFDPSIYPPRKGSSELAMPPPSYNWSDKQFAPETAFEFEHVEHTISSFTAVDLPCGGKSFTIPQYPSETFSTYPSTGANLDEMDVDYVEEHVEGPSTSLVYLPTSPSTSYTPPRPGLKRRDTPRPALPTLSSLTAQSNHLSGEERKRTLRSAVDGGHWVVME